MQDRVARMAAEFDPTEFVDTDFSSKTSYVSTATAAAPRPPTREENEAHVNDMRAKLNELKRAQDELEREKSQVEETRRKQLELENGRAEMLENLTRGVALLEEASFDARRNAEQMTKALEDFREALAKIQTIREDAWTQETFSMELTRALTIIENARMEWNSARTRFDILSGAPAASTGSVLPVGKPGLANLQSLSFVHLCRLGLALTWPVGTAVIIAAILLLAFRR